MATGKTAAKYSQVLCDGYDISGDSHTYGLGVTFPELDTSGLSATVKETLAGIPALMANLKLWFNNTASSGAYSLLKSAGVQRILSIPIGIRAAVAFGDPVFAASLTQKEFITDIAVGAAVGITVPFVGPGTTQPGQANPFGYTLEPNTHLTGTTSGSVHDNLAASAGGALGYLHVTVAGGSWAVTILHDTQVSMATATTLMTFTANGSAITAEQQAATGTVKRYTQAVFTRTSGNFDGAVFLVRG